MVSQLFDKHTGVLDRALAALEDRGCCALVRPFVFFFFKLWAASHRIAS